MVRRKIKVRRKRKIKAGKTQYKNEMTEKFDDMLLSKVRNEECYDSYDDYSKDMMDFTSANIF